MQTLCEGLLTILRNKVANKRSKKIGKLGLTFFGLVLFGIKIVIMFGLSFLSCFFYISFSTSFCYGENLHRFNEVFCLTTNCMLL